MVHDAGKPLLLMFIRDAFAAFRERK